MFGLLRPCLIRLSGAVATRQTFGNLADCLKIAESSQSIATTDLYEAFKFISSSGQIRRQAIHDDRFVTLLDQLDARISTLNCSYMGNFGIRLGLIIQSLGNLDREDPIVEKSVKVIERLCTEMMEKSGNIKEISQLAFAAASAGLQHKFLDYAKQNLTLNIENADPDVLNLALLASYKTKVHDKVFLALICEKLSELTDRFTANDVVSTLRSLEKTSLMKGFLLRRLSMLIHDNLEQFTNEQLAQCCYRLSILKFQTPVQYSTILSLLEPKFQQLSIHLQIEVLASGCMCQCTDANERLVKLAKSITLTDKVDLAGLVNYIYSCVYLKLYKGDHLTGALEEALARSPFLIRKYALLFKEAYDTLSLECPNLTLELPEAWKMALENYESAEHDRCIQTSIIAETGNILKTSAGDFETFSKVGPFTVAFADVARKLVILAETPNTLGGLALAQSNGLQGGNYKVLGMASFENRVCPSGFHCSHITVDDKMTLHLRSRKSELSYAFKRFDKSRLGVLSHVQFVRLLGAIGIHLTRQELKFLQFGWCTFSQDIATEEDIRGGFTLEDLEALGRDFYNDEVIATKVLESLQEHFGPCNTLDKQELASVLMKLGMDYSGV
ncbi:bifunctional EF-hand domain pair/EF-hand domain [Babesia duncani]|uniref:Bifunctional EF-hand domain pair/EF-hand domain n=1 Tax=Babesia duncani TaxID=323732 RepID=A0AAD9UNW3_9APIC|nr:bifunctional EF-hand domain pair/EF-hand domain [Babesia duncani]